jgi:hypothetical protein
MYIWYSMIVLFFLFCYCITMIGSTQKKDRWDDVIKIKLIWRDWVKNFFLSLLIGGIIGGGGGGIVLTITSLAVVPKEYEYGWDNKIVAMKDNTAYVVGRHGYVDESDRYYYMVDHGNGRYKSHWVNQENSVIIESAEGPYVIKTYVENRKPRNGFERDLTKFIHWFDSGSLKHKWEFIVPKGSIVQDFNLDME